MSDEPPRISNETQAAGAGGPISELMRLQSDFYARLTDELLRYLRGLQATLAPVTPGTVVRAAAGLTLRAAAAPGATAELGLVLENVQRVHCLATVALSPLVASDGTTWYPQTRPPFISKLVAPDETAALSVPVQVPDDMPAGTYRGALHLQGFRGGALPVELTVTAAAAAVATAAAGAAP
jgi:hypothetical protein